MPRYTATTYKARNRFLRACERDRAADEVLFARQVLRDNPTMSRDEALRVAADKLAHNTVARAFPAEG